MRRASLVPAILMMLLLVSSAAATTSAVGTKKKPKPSYAWRWDLATIAGGILNPRGAASAVADDGSKITLSSASGKFGKAGGRVSGGGSWITYNPSGAVISVGTFTLKSLIGFFPIAGALPNSVTTDTLGPRSRARAGLAVFGVAYSNGYTGTLVLGSKWDGSPATALSGVTATWGPIGFFKAVALPAASTDVNRVAFHRLR